MFKPPKAKDVTRSGGGHTCGTQWGRHVSLALPVPNGSIMSTSPKRDLQHQFMNQCWTPWHPPYSLKRQLDHGRMQACWPPRNPVAQHLMLCLLQKRSMLFAALGLSLARPWAVETLYPASGIETKMLAEKKSIVIPQKE